MNTKICNICGIEKDLNEFPKEKGKSRNPCKKCRNNYLKEYYIKHKEKAKEHNKMYYIQNKEKILLVNKKYRLENKNKISEQKKKYIEKNKNEINKIRKIYYENNKEKILNENKEYRKKNKEKIAIRRKKYYENNKEKIIEKIKTNNAKRKQEDSIYRLKCQIRSMIKDCFKRKSKIKNEKSEKILGCDIEFFQKYLLETYKKNYGIEWDGIEKVHIDHIIPLSNANTEKEIIKLCNYKNLQLLKAKDNLEKGNKLDWELKKW